MLNTEKDCIEYIHSAGRFGKKAGLENIKALLALLGNPEKDLKCIHIAGTNGKGSTACLIASALCAHGFKTGMNTSPYIEKFNERLCINSEPIPAERLVHCTRIVAEAVERLRAEGRYLIEFEIIAAIGFLYFMEEKCDYVILECGLGGRFDATNVIERPLLSVICTIGLDHTEILGDTVEKIAFEKAGIIKRSRPVVLHPSLGERALGVIMQKAAQTASPVFKTEGGAKITGCTYRGTDFEYEGAFYHLGLAGAYQVENALLAINALKHIPDANIGSEDIKNGFAAASWKCRFECIADRFVIDGAHNPQGMKEFARSVSLILKGAPVAVVTGILNDKDFEKSVEYICSLGAPVIVTDVPSARQTDGGVVFDCVKELTQDARYIPDYKDAVKAADALVPAGGFVCITGSLYLAGAARTFIRSFAESGRRKI